MSTTALPGPRPAPRPVPRRGAVRVHPVPAAPAAARAGWIDPSLLLAFGLVAVAAAGATVGAGGLMRLAFPAGALAIAGALFLSRRTEDYLIFCLWLFVLTPWLRRYVDLHAGWLPVNHLMLAPWVASSLTLTVLFRAVAGPRFPMSGGLLLVALATSYGLVIAVVGGKAVPGAFDWLRWTVPPCFGATALLARAAFPTLPDRLLRFFVASSVLLGVYGVFQFLSPPAWDVLWMKNVLMESIGKPEPFMVRVYSLMNSPGPLGAFLVIACCYLFAFATPVRVAALGLGAVGVLLSLNRTAWGAGVLILAYLVALGPAVTKLRAVVAGAVVVMLLPLAFTVPEIAMAFEDRYRTLTDIGTDASYLARIEAYDSFFRTLDQQIVGQGLATSGSLLANAKQGGGVVIDGQLIEVFVTYGLFVGALYFAGAIGCAVSATLAGLRSRDTFALVSSGVALSALPLIFYGSPFSNETGISIWLAIGLSHPAAAAPPAGRAP